ncbi:WD40 repeat-like protein [Rhizopus microsporus ATCC 52813]|uniref:WD40 repeat-like protein n=1 Tax=Rhizopus microsporus ATCC 52813 TaxID=1340429 RepID=A0A2G4T5U0_RHIZD|nr:WD40 repeat-like protein [Rhizopus microsporus ATCC 52813]PHZ16393.1 WD40 repeat-like protein [Rhizopus microsporus ATCC 52813]
MGHQPRIFIWDVKEKTIFREFKAHKFGVLSLSFSPNMRYLVSVGFQHDGYLYVWDWKKGIKLAGNKVTSRVNAISFSKDGSFFVTAGLRHVKFWYLDSRGRMPKKGVGREMQVLDGRSGLLGVLRDANFVDVACDHSSGYTYFVTDSGILCIFKEGRVIDKWVNLQVKSAFSIAVSSIYVICTCSEGIIRLFEPVTLKYLGILPKPHPLGVDISAITSPDMIRSTDDTNVYPDAVAIVYDDAAQRITTVYSDRSLYIWDIHDLQKIGKYRSFIFHSDCVWGVEPCPTIESEGSIIPANSFATFSGDGTIRIWNLDHPVHPSSSSPLTPPQLSPPLMTPSSSTMVSAQRRNIYSRELVKMLYVDPDAAEFMKQSKHSDYAEDQYPDFGIRSLKMSSDGKWMASGDRSGNLRLHCMKTWDLLGYQEAHDSEILSIDLTTGQDDTPRLVATASRDRLLHIFDLRSNCQLVQSLDDHSSSITAVKFSKDSSKLISCSADKGIIFRQRQHPVTPFHDTSTPRPYITYHNHSGRGTVFDMALDVTGRYIATVTGERKLYVFSVDSGKPFRVCKPEMSDEVGKDNSGGSLINIDLDPFSGTYAVTSGSDKYVRLFDLTNSTCIEKVGAHAELITSVKFLRTNTEENGLRVISTCSDGTVFVWKVSPEVVAKMCARGGIRLKTEEKQVMFNLPKQPAIAGQQQQQQQQRLRRVSTATAIRPTASISQMIRQNERKTFSTMSTAEHKYDEMYKRIEASRRNRNNNNDEPIEEKIAPNKKTLADKVNKPPLEKSGRLERLLNGYPTAQKRLTTRPQAPVNNKLVLNMANARRSQPGRNNAILEREMSPPQMMRKTSPVLMKRKSQPALSAETNTATNGQRRASDSMSPPRHKAASPVDNRVEDEEEIYDDAVEEFHEEEEEDDDDEAEEEEEIIFTPEQEKTSGPFEVSTHLDTPPLVHTDEEEDDGQSTPSHEDEEENSESSVDDDAILRDIASIEPPRVSASVSRSKSIKRQSITAKFLSSLTNNGPDHTNQRPSIHHVLDTFKEHEKTLQKEQDPKIESALADLDGIEILLDSVLDTLVNTIKTSDNEKSIETIETKLIQIADKVQSKVPKKKDVEQETDTETAKLLERYSNLLLNMVESKLKKSIN